MAVMGWWYIAWDREEGTGALHSFYKSLNEQQPPQPQLPNSVMDISFPILLSLVAFLLFLLVILKARRKPSPTFPPGPSKLPIIGSMHHLAGALPHRILADLAKKYGPLMHLQLGEVSTIVVSSPELAKQVMKTHDIIFSSRPYIPSQGIFSYGNKDIAVAPYGEYWRQLRKICMVELLSLKRVQSYGPIRERVVSNTIQTIASGAGSPVNLSNMIYSTTIGVVLRAAFGETCRFQEKFIQVVKKSTQLAGGLSLPDVFPSRNSLFVLSGRKYRCEKVHKEIDKILSGIIEEHKARKREGKGISDQQEAEDLVQVLLDIQDRGDLQFSLTTSDIKGVIQDIFVAGSDTSSSTVEWAMSEMLRNPRTLEKAQVEVRDVFGRKGKVDDEGLQELKYMKSVIKETLRTHPPLALLIPRESMDECELNGYNIPSKTQVIVNAWAIGRDPDYWTEPDKFFPERFLESSVDFKGNHFEFIPFGAGRRICPGMPFGLANAERLLAELLFHFDWKLPSGKRPQELDMTEKFGAVVARKNKLYLTPVPYRK